MNKLTPLVEAEILKIWECANPTFFPTEDVYSLIFETKHGFLETKGMTKNSYMFNLRNLQGDSKISSFAEHFSPKCEFLENPERYPHLKITEIKDIGKYLLCLKLQE